MSPRTGCATGFEPEETSWPPLRSSGIFGGGALQLGAEIEIAGVIAGSIDVGQVRRDQFVAGHIDVEEAAQGSVIAVSIMLEFIPICILLRVESGCLQS